MSDQSQKAFPDESDPQTLALRANDQPGSFLDVYRSQSVDSVPQDEQLVDKSVIAGVIPERIRYGVMQRGQMRVLRGVIKSTAGDFYYFSWSPSTAFKLIPADDATKRWEAKRLDKSCSLGCDLIRSGSSNYPEEDDEDTEKAGGEVPGAAVAPVDEDYFAQQQQSMMHEAHPGSTQSALPDDPTRGRDWHTEEPLRRAVDGMAPLATNDGARHWTTGDLMKAFGAQLQRTAPRAAPLASPLEQQYMHEVLGASAEQIDKGLNLAPRHQADFAQWKSSRLRRNLSGLLAWLERK